MTFYQWLSKQKSRDDHIGDFARDSLSTDDFPKKCKTLKSMRPYLIDKGACSEALFTCRDAWSEYQASS